MELETVLDPAREVHVQRLRQNIHLDDEGKEEDGHQGKTDGLGGVVVSNRLEGRGDRGDQHADEREDKGDHQLQDAAHVDAGDDKNEAH